MKALNPRSLLIALLAAACGREEFAGTEREELRFDQREEIDWRDDEGADWTIVVWGFSEHTAPWNSVPDVVARDLVTKGAGMSDRDLNEDGEPDLLVCSADTHRAVVWDGASLRRFGKIGGVSFVDDRDQDGTPDLWIRFRGSAAMMLGGSGTMRFDSSR